MPHFQLYVMECPADPAVLLPLAQADSEGISAAKLRALIEGRATTPALIGDGNDRRALEHAEARFNALGVPVCIVESEEGALSGFRLVAVGLRELFGAIVRGGLSSGLSSDSARQLKLVAIDLAFALGIINVRIGLGVGGWAARR